VAKSQLGQSKAVVL